MRNHLHKVNHKASLLTPRQVLLVYCVICV